MRVTLPYLMVAEKRPGFAGAGLSRKLITAHCDPEFSKKPAFIGPENIIAANDLSIT